MSEAASLELLAKLPLYETRKVARAAKIAYAPFVRPSYRNGRLVVPILVAGHHIEFFPVSLEVETILKAMNPQGGWYLVFYEGGHVSASPPKHFEASATLLRAA